MKLIREPYLFSPEQVKKIEELRNARWLLDTEHKGHPVSVFWQDEAHPNGSNFFALYYKNVPWELMITDGAFILDQSIRGIMLPSGNVIYSRYVHDFFEREGVAIDGGRSYTRVVGDSSLYRFVTIRVTEQGEIKIDT